jgi:hypothetical protein
MFDDFRDMGFPIAEFTIEGRIYSKKNGSNIVFPRKGKNGRANRAPIILSNPRYLATQSDYRTQILGQVGHANLPFPGVYVSVSEIWGNNIKWIPRYLDGQTIDPEAYKGWDVDNKMQSIHDLLTYSEVLYDDSQIQGVMSVRRFGKAPWNNYGARVRLYACKNIV